MSTEHFSRALYAAHDDGNATRRAEAEAFLIALKESADGFRLACTIISAEPFDQLRTFWAFNTLIFHINAVSSTTTRSSAISSADEAQSVYDILGSWIRRGVVERDVPDFILNKHAQTVVIGMYAFYPEAWPSFFDDLFDFIEMKDRGGGDQVVMYFLRVFEYIDEVVVDRSAQRTPSQRGRDMAIKDLMREVAVRRAVDVWYNILTVYHNRGPGAGLEVAQLCLSVLSQYIEWIDVSLLLTSYWVNLLYFLMSIHPLRVGACECISQLAAKKQIPTVKIETLHALNVVEALGMLTPIVTAQMPSTEEEEHFVVSVALFIVNSAQHLIECAEHEATSKNASQMLKDVIPHVLSLMTIPLLSLRDVLVPFIQSYTKWAPLDELQSILECVFSQTCRPGVAGPLSLEMAAQDGRADDSDAHADSSKIFEERDVEHRKSIYTSLRIINRRAPQLVGEHCQFVWNHVLGSEPSMIDEHDAEGAIRYVFELGETVRVDQLRSPNDASTTGSAIPFYNLTKSLLHSRLVREHPGPLVHLAFFELLDRFHSFFFFAKDDVPTLLQLFLASPNGIVNPHPRTRARICYIFVHLSSGLKQQFVPFSDAIADAISPVLSPVDRSSVLTPSDKADLYEGLGAIFAAANALHRCEEMLLGILKHMNVIAAAMQNGSVSLDQGATVLSDCIGFLTSLAKGVGGLEANRMPESPSQGPAPAPHGLFPSDASSPSPVSALEESDRAINAAVAAAQNDPLLSVFMRVLEHVAQLCLTFMPFGSIRDKTIICVQQLLNILGVAALPVIETLIAAMLSTTSISELPRILRILYQTVNRTRSACAAVMSRTLLPRTMERVASFGEISDLKVQLNVISESAREMAEMYRLYFNFIQALVQNSAAVALQHPDEALVLGTLLAQMNRAVTAPIESDVVKPALGALTRLAAVLCDANSTFEAFLFDTILPSIIGELTSGSVDFRDGKVLVIVGELCLLLRTAAEKLGDRSLFRLYALLTSSISCVTHDEANAFCGVLHDSTTARNTMHLRQATKNLLETIASRRYA